MTLPASAIAWPGSHFPSQKHNFVVETMTIPPLFSQFRQFCPLCETIKPFCYVCAVCSGNVSFLKGYTLQCSAVYLHPLPTRRQSFEDLSGWRNRFLRPVPAFSLIIPHSIVFGHPSLFFDQMPSVSDENLPRLLFSWFFFSCKEVDMFNEHCSSVYYTYQPIYLVFASTLPTVTVGNRINFIKNHQHHLKHLFYVDTLQSTIRKLQQANATSWWYQCHTHRGISKLFQHHQKTQQTSTTT